VVHYSANRDSRSHGFDGYSEEIISNITFEIEPDNGIGPGLGQAERLKCIVSILKRIKVPLVIDADALNILSK
jgi:NAD(P)H-hydrate repair Nnr-like enzyme with NAD(P)H-hydrate dehydratase domain